MDDAVNPFREPLFMHALWLWNLLQADDYNGLDVAGMVEMRYDPATAETIRTYRANAE